ncbi:MAG: hypothetical protein H7Y60_13600 [Rhodospirillaceae bacterium]|nr:hypothetical protein [Rhodospirillales bacterium]
MRHLLSVADLPADQPLFILGAGAGGEIVWDELERHGLTPAGIIDDVVTGTLRHLTIQSSADFAARYPPQTLILIASQHWRAIGRTLRKRGLINVLDASPLIRSARDAKAATAAQAELAALESAAGVRVEDILKLVPKTEHEQALDEQMAALNNGHPVPFVILGSGEAAWCARMLLRRYGFLHLVSFVHGTNANFVDLVDVCPTETFLAEENPAHAPVLFCADPDWAELAPRFQARGFTRVIDVYPLLDHRPPARPAPPRTSLGMEMVVAETAMAALRQSHAEIVGWCPPGTQLTTDAATRALAILRERPEIHAVIGDTAFTLVELLCHGRQPNCAFFRRQTWDDSSDFALWCSLATESKIATLPGLCLPIWRPAVENFPTRAAALGALFAHTGFLVGKDRLWRQCLIRQHALCRQLEGLPEPGAAVYDQVARIYEQRGQIDEALTVWDAARQFKDATLDGLACQAFLKHPDATNEQQMERQMAWARTHAPAPYRPMTVAAAPKRPIRVGYACAFSSAPYFNFQVLPIVAKHDRDRFHAFCYLDRATAQACAAAPTVRAVAGLDDAAFARQIRSDGIDILVELTGFSPGHRYGAMAERCAPVQISYVNHTGTCGTANVDYCLADGIAAPPGLDPFYTETIYRLPGSFFCFDFTGDPFPPVPPPPVLESGCVTFGCFASGSKINDCLIALWAELLRQSPGSRLLLCNEGLTPPANRAFLAQRFARHGIASGQLDLRPGTDRSSIKRLYSQVDISLDTWPYCGGNTIAESLMSGVPVVTLTGTTFASRYGASLLAASGGHDLVAHDPAEYVANAVALAGDHRMLGELRTSRREAMQQFGFSDSAAFAAKLEAAYEAMLTRIQALDATSPV